MANSRNTAHANILQNCSRLQLTSFPFVSTRVWEQDWKVLLLHSG